jgi:hypothetical protein
MGARADFVAETLGLLAAEEAFAVEVFATEIQDLLSAELV